MTDVNLWSRTDHAHAYLARADAIPRRGEGQEALLEWIPAHATRILDLGAGDGRLLAAVLEHLPVASGVALDFSSAMLDRLHARFPAGGPVLVVEHDLDRPLPPLGAFDAVVSSFAIHHVSDQRKAQLYAEVYDALVPGGMFCNLEHVASATPALHLAFLDALGVAPDEDDPSNKLAPVETQLGWLRDIGFEDVDCQWKWRELALLVGRRPLAPARDPVAG